MSIPFNRVVLLGVFLFTYAFLIYVLDLFGVMKYITGIVGLPVVSYGAWYFIFANEPKESMAEVGRQLHGKYLSTPQAVRKTTIGVLVVLLGLLGISCSSKTFVFTPTGDDTLAVYSAGPNGHLTLVGYATKQEPFRKRLWLGKHRFIFKGDGYIDQERVVDVSLSFFDIEEQQQVELGGPTDFIFSDLRVSDESVELASAEKLPERLSGRPSRLLSFSVASASCTPFEMTRVTIQVQDETATEDWNFPYYGEASLDVEALAVKGFAELKPGMKHVQVEDTDIPTVGRRQGLAAYRIRLFGEPPYRYRISVSVRWRSINQPNRTGTTTSKKQVTVAFNQDWRSLIRDSGKTRILFNGRVNALLPELDKLVQPSTYEILVVDPRAAMFIERGGLKLPANVRVLPVGQETRFMHLIMAAGPTFTRPCNFIAVDSDRLLLQETNDLQTGKLLCDKNKVEALIREFDTAMRQGR